MHQSGPIRPTVPGDLSYPGAVPGGRADESPAAWPEGAVHWPGANGIRPGASGVPPLSCFLASLSFAAHAGALNCWLASLS
jgi:hypothetical protein